jgi:TRAP-type C4-dicarboxylate transport system permease small subunit
VPAEKEKVRLLSAIERRLVSLEKAVLTGLIAFMVTLAFAQVALRHIGRWTGLSLSLMWGDPLVRILVLWLAFLGAAVAAAEDKQFAMDALSRVLTPKKRAAAALICHVFTSVVCAGLLYASIGFFHEEFSNSQVLFSLFGHDVPTWPFETILPAGFFLLLVHYAVKAGQEAMVLGGAPKEEAA